MIAVRLSLKRIVEARCNRQCLRDTIVPQLLFRYSLKPEVLGYYHCRYTKNGKTTTQVLGKSPYISVEQARDEARAHLRFIALQKHKPATFNSFVTIGELLNWYAGLMRQQLPVTSNTLKNQSHRIERLLLPLLSKILIHELTASKLQADWLVPLLNHYSASTLQGAFQTLKHALLQADSMAYLTSHPVELLTFSTLHPAKIEPRQCSLTGMRLSSVVAGIQKLKWQTQMQALLSLAYLTRKRETALARWEHFDFDIAQWYIPAKNTKTGVALTLPLTQFPMNWLKAYKQEQRKYRRSQFLFPQTKGRRPISASQAAQRIANQSKRTMSFHDLRKYGSSYMRDQGTDYYLVERLLNHQKTALDNTYIHTSLQSPLRHALARWHEAIDDHLSEA